METTKRGIKWDAETERDLFAACLVVCGEPKGATLRQAVEILNERGLDCTVKAASHRMSAFTSPWCHSISRVGLEVASQLSLAFSHFSGLNHADSFFSQHLQKLKRKDGTAPNNGDGTPSKKGVKIGKRVKADEDAGGDEGPAKKKRATSKTKKAPASQPDDEESKPAVKKEVDV